MLKPHKKSGLLARSLGSIRSPKSKRTPRIHPDTGDMIQIIAPRKEQSKGKTYQRKGRSKPTPRDPRFYAHLVDSGNYQFKGIDFYGRSNKNKSLCSYLNDKHEIWQATLRNAHPLADDDPLTQTGGVLISKEDVGTLERDEFSTHDNFDYDLKIFLENEHGGTGAEKAARNANSITLHVCCIYLNQLILKGSSTQLSFVEARPTD